MNETVTIGTSISLLVIGSILRYAVSWRLAAVDIQMIGAILMVAGIAGLTVSLAWIFQTVARDRRIEAGREVADLYGLPNDCGWTSVYPTTTVPYDPGRPAPRAADPPRSGENIRS